MALSTERDTPRMGADAVIEQLSVPVAAATKIYRGGLVCLNLSGYAVPGSASAALRAIGRAESTQDNTGGSAGDLDVEVSRGTFRFANSAGDDAITLADVGQPCYVVDDQTVARTDANGVRSYAGRVMLKDATGVWVELGIAPDPRNTDILLEAAADLSSSQYLFVELDSNGDVTVCNAAGEAAVGVLQNAPASGAVAIVRVAGVSNVIASTSVAAGAKVATTSAGKSKAAVAGTGTAGSVTNVTDSALGAYTDPPSAGEMAATRSLVNQIRTAILDADTAISAAQALAGSFVMGMALTAGTTDTAHQVLLQPMGLIPTTAA